MIFWQICVCCEDVIYRSSMWWQNWRINRWIWRGQWWHEFVQISSHLTILFDSFLFSIFRRCLWSFFRSFCIVYERIFYSTVSQLRIFIYLLWRICSLNLRRYSLLWGCSERQHLLSCCKMNPRLIWGIFSANHEQSVQNQ